MHTTNISLISPQEISLIQLMTGIPLRLIITALERTDVALLDTSTPVEETTNAYLHTFDSGPISAEPPDEIIGMVRKIIFFTHFSA